MPAGHAKSGNVTVTAAAQKIAAQPGRTSSRHRLKRPIRIAFVLRSFTYGGAEHDIIQLVTASDPSVLSIVGMAVQMPYPVCPDLCLDDSRVPPIHQPGATTKHAKVINAESFAAAVRTVAANADVIVAWGVPDLAEVLPPDFRGRIVVTSKASGEYQESFLHANSLCTADYVANSVKSGEAFPEAVRHRVRVIYPGIDERRLVRTCDRRQQRAAWGFGPADRIVGYFGRIAPDKGVEPLVESVSRMGRNWKAVFVGRNGNFRDYEQRFARLCRRRLPGRHRIVDWTTDVGSTLAAFDVLAYTTEDEGFSNTLAESWMLSVPTVATAGVGALAEPRWADCSITIPRTFTPEELCRALKTACGNEQLVARAKRRARALTVKSAISAWQSYFTELMQRPRRTRVMVLLPNALIGVIPSWLLTLMRHSPQIDWCSLCILSESPEHTAHSEILDDVLERGCPVQGIPPLSNAETQRRLLQAISNTRPDVVLQCGVKQLDDRYPDCSIPLVTVSHGPDDCGWAREVLANSSRKAARRVAISETARDAFPPEFREGVSIITNGVHVPPMKDLRPPARRLARERLGLTIADIAVGYVGRLSAEKRPLNVAKAVACLPKAFRAVFIGPDCADLLTEIRQATSRFVHVGQLAPDQIAPLLPGLDVLVCSSDYESFGLAIVEAWAAMVPVVSTPVGIIGKLADQHDVAVVVPLNPSPRSLARAIRQAIDEREGRIHVCRELARSDYNARRMGRDWQLHLQAIAKDQLTSAPD